MIWTRDPYSISAKNNNMLKEVKNKTFFELFPIYSLYQPNGRHNLITEEWCLDSISISSFNQIIFPFPC